MTIQSAFAGLGIWLVVLAAVIALTPRRSVRKSILCVLGFSVFVNFAFLADSVSQQLSPQVWLGVEENNLQFTYGDPDGRITGVVVSNPPLHMRGPQDFLPWFPIATNLLFGVTLILLAMRTTSAGKDEPASSVSGAPLRML